MGAYSALIVGRNTHSTDGKFGTTMTNALFFDGTRATDEQRKPQSETLTVPSVGNCGFWELACYTTQAAVIEISVYRQRIARQQCGVGR